MDETNPLIGMLEQSRASRRARTSPAALTRSGGSVPVVPSGSAAGAIRQGIRDRETALCRPGPVTGSAWLRGQLRLGY